MTPALPTDSVLPYLAHALDPRAMAATFAVELDGVSVLACEVDRVKYRPQRNCSVSYRLQLRDTRSGRCFEQRVAARFCSVADAARRHQQALACTVVASAAGPALSYDSTLGMLAHWLPNDAKLGAVRLLGSESDMRRHALPEVVAALTKGRGRLVDHHVTLVQVVPELRVCARVVLWVKQTPDAAVSRHTLYAKADVEGSGANTQAVMQALHQSVAQSRGLLRTPAPLLWQESADLHWQLALPGRALQDADRVIGPASSARVGAALAALHATPVPSLRTLGVDELRASMYRAAGLLERVQPAWRPLLARLVDRLEGGFAALSGEAAATLHGDLHPRNILVDVAEGEGDGKAARRPFALIDLDGLHAGPAVLELGAWVADALYRATLAGTALLDSAPSWRAFLATYAQAGGRCADPTLLAWSTAHDLLCKRALRCVANLKPGRFPAVPRLLALADAIAQAGRVDAALDAEAAEREDVLPSPVVEAA
jgi:hypothetical protein